jgi:hypothetical protein
LSLATPTPVEDFERVATPLTNDEVNNNALLLFLFRASDPTQFEIVSVIAIAAEGGGVYGVTGRRLRYGTQLGGDGSYIFTTDDLAFLIFRSDLVPFASEDFARVSAGELQADFRLQPASVWFTPELDDVYDAGTNPNGLVTAATHDFSDPYPPSAEWLGFQANTGSGGAWQDMTTMQATQTNILRFSFRMNDRNADLVGYTLLARKGAGAPIVLATENLAPAASYARAVEFTLSQVGQYRILLQIRDQAGRVTEQPLTAVGDPDEVTLLIQAGSPTQVASPMFTAHFMFTESYLITCATAGATIYYQLLNYGSAPTSTWTTYPAGTYIYRKKNMKVLYAYATKAGLTDSAIVSV